MVNLEKLATLGTQDTGRRSRQTKQKTQHRKLTRWATLTPHKPGVKPCSFGEQTVPSSYKTPLCYSCSQDVFDTTIRKQTQIT